MTPGDDRVPARRGRAPTIAVIGSGSDPETPGTTGTGAGAAELFETARELGAQIAAAGATLVCGGRGGVMAAACEGAAQGGGRTVGLLPGTSPDDANPWVEVALATGLGEARNALVVGAADAVVAVGGGYGTLSEIALALRAGTPVVGIGTWRLRPDPTAPTPPSPSAIPPPGTSPDEDEPVVAVDDPADAVRLALELAARRRRPQRPAARDPQAD